MNKETKTSDLMNKNKCKCGKNHPRLTDGDTVDFDIGMSVSNMILRHEIKIPSVKTSPLSDKNHEILQDGIFFWGVLTSNYLEKKLVDNNELQKLIGDVNLKKFVEDIDYYYHIFEYHRHHYDILCDYIKKRFHKYNEYIFNFIFNDQLDNKLTDIIQFNFDYYDIDVSIRYTEEGYVLLKEKTEMDTSKSIKDTIKRKDDTKGRGNWGLSFSNHEEYKGGVS